MCVKLLKCQGVSECHKTLLYHVNKEYNSWMAQMDKENMTNNIHTTRPHAVNDSLKKKQKKKGRKIKISRVQTSYHGQFKLRNSNKPTKKTDQYILNSTKK